MTDGAVHVPVMMSQVLEYLAPTPGNRYIDCTLGLGGHSEAVLERSAPDGELLGLDADPAALALARARLEVFGQRVVLVQANFDRLEAQARAHGFVDVDGVLFDLGVSSLQLGLSGRGFTFRASEPLDMRMDPTSGPTAADLLATLTERELADLIYQYGEDRASRRIARSIVYHRERRALETTDDLVGAIISAVGGQRGRIHPATRTFQALRIAVNRELEVLPVALEQALRLLRSGGRLVVISFHSLEDRIVKRFMLERASATASSPIRIMTRRPIAPDEAETRANPRARSAKLRACQRAA
jgi:16S rRNA (cytosine1402-N4)-methyltransferase